MEYLQYYRKRYEYKYDAFVLNLVINGIPSILENDNISFRNAELSFKPCYKWNTFNTIRRN